MSNDQARDVSVAHPGGSEQMTCAGVRFMCNIRVDIRP